jgi:hypothetical protein
MNLNLRTSAAGPHFALKSVGRLAFVLGAMSLSTLHLSASPTIYSAFDLNAGPGDPTPNSNAAYASFAAASGSLGLITFEALLSGTSLRSTPLPA